MLLATESAAAAVGAAFAVAALAAAWRFEAGMGDPDGFDAIRTTFVAVLLLVGVGEIATAIPFLVWLHRSMRNAPDLGARASAYSPRRAVAAWFIPFVNLLIPYRVMLDLHDRLAAPEESPAGRRLTRAWWIAWLASSIFIGAGSLVRQSSAYFALLALALTWYFVAAILAIGVVRQVERLASARRARITGRDADAAALAERARNRRLLTVPTTFATAGGLLLLGLLGAVAIDRPPDARWATFISPSGSFAVSLPRVPIDKPSTIETDVGPIVQHLFASSLDTQETFAVVYVDFPAGWLNADPDAALDQLVAGITAESKTIATEKPTLGGIAGRGTRVELADGTIAVLRYFLRGNRMYVLEVDLTPDRATSANVARFFSSFTLQP